MTKAAKEVHLTQPGISQHIHSLEESLNLKLFDRLGRHLIPTHHAEILFKQCSRAIHAFEHALTELSGQKNEIRGVVRIGTPVEFGNNLLMRLMTEFSKKNPKIQFVIRYGLAQEVAGHLFDGSLDFAFTDAFRLEHGIQTTPVYKEVLHLCAHQSLAGSKGKLKLSPTYFESLPYVDYEPGAPVLRMWLKHHFGSTGLDPRLLAHGLDAQGVARWVVSGVAAGVLPDHLVKTLKSRGHNLQVFSGRAQPLVNQISLAQVNERTLSPAALLTRDTLKSSLSQLK